MCFLEFFILFVLNASLLIVMIRWRRIASCEGIALSMLLLYVSSYAIPIMLSAVFTESMAESAEVESTMATSLWPMAVHFIGLISLFAGLKVMDPKPLVMTYCLTDALKRELSRFGYALIFIGLFMKILGLYLAGVGGLFDYLNGLYNYDVSVREFGFLDLGVAFAAFGYTALIVSNENNGRIQLLWMALGLLTVTLLSTSKSGFLLVAIPLYIATKTFSEKTLRRWTRLWVLIPAGILFIVVLGIKSQVKYLGFSGLDLAPATIVEMAMTIILMRVSDVGLFSGFVNLVNRVTADSSLALHGGVFSGVFTGLVPRFVWEEIFDMQKPDHPFKGLGGLVNPDYIVDPHGNDAPTLFGFSFVDFGLASLVVYSLLGGVALGLIRRRLGSGRSNALLMAYIFFASSFGPSLPESGFLSIIYYLIVSIFVSTIFVLANKSYTVWPSTKLLK